MRPSRLFSMFSRSSRRSPVQARPARKSRLAAGERLAARLNLAATLFDLAVPREASGGYPAYEQFPIPAGATLVDVSDSGQFVLYSSTDTNVIAGQQTIPSLNPDLFWLDTKTGETRLVTHRAGSEVQSAGYAGLETATYTPGYGLWPMFQPQTADLSGDGQTWGAPVATGKGTGPLTEIRFPAAPAKFIRITQTGSVDGLFWSIHELGVLAFR
jgi:hypothetical protein